MLTKLSILYAKKMQQTVFLFVCLFFNAIPGSSVSKESACSAGDPGSITGSGRWPGEGNANPLQYSCLERLMDRGAWRATVHGFTRVRQDLVTKQQQHQLRQIQSRLEGLVNQTRSHASVSIHVCGTWWSLLVTLQFTARETLALRFLWQWATLLTTAHLGMVTSLATVTFKRMN